MKNINREHPEYIARKAMWKQYRDLYAGGERLRANASEYLVRRHKEPGEVYQERLSRVFYENYIGSIVDWYAATLMRREPVLLFEGSDTAAKSFYSVLADDCDLKGTSLSEFFRQRFVQTWCAAAATSWWIFRGRSAGARPLTRAEEDASGRSRAYLVDYGPDEVINWNYDPIGRAGVGGDPDLVPAAIEGHGCEVGAGDAVDLLRPRELPDLPAGGRIEPDRADGRGAARAGGAAAGAGVPDEGVRGAVADEQGGAAATGTLQQVERAFVGADDGAVREPVVYSDREWNQIVGESYYIQLGQDDRFGWTEPEGKVYQIAADNLDQLKDEIYRVCYLMIQAGDVERRRRGSRR